MTELAGNFLSEEKVCEITKNGTGNEIHGKCGSIPDPTG